jgi:hypothetical protein
MYACWREKDASTYMGGMGFSGGRKTSVEGTGIDLRGGLIPAGQQKRRKRKLRKVKVRR